MTKYLIALVLILGALGAIALYTPKQKQASFGAFPSSTTVIGAATTSTAISVTSSVRILATTTSIVGKSYQRVYASICNPSATLVYLNMDNDKAASASTTTAIIAAAAGYNACFEISDRNSYSGSVTASSTNQTAATVSVKDYVQ